MNARDILHYADTFFQDALQRIPPAEMETPDVCGVWSTKDIVAHLASIEHWLEDVLSTYLDGGPTPCLDEFLKVGGDRFNSIEVGQRKNKSYADTLAEYNDRHRHTLELIARIPHATLLQPGTLPWYGMEYALDDFIVYQYYGHKREHGAQVNVFADLLKEKRRAKTPAAIP